MRSVPTDFSLIEQDQILRAAEGAISYYEKKARAESDRRVQANQAAALNAQAD